MQTAQSQGPFARAVLHDSLAVLPDSPVKWFWGWKWFSLIL
jgi:hypothetical protein